MRRSIVAVPALFSIRLYPPDVPAPQSLGPLFARIEFEIENPALKPPVADPGLPTIVELLIWVVAPLPLRMATLVLPVIVVLEMIRPESQAPWLRSVAAALGEVCDVPVVAQQPGADPAAVIFDAWDAARARDIDVLLADTAGRLQNQQGLMDELAKVKRVISRRDETAPHEIMLVLDASQGQNALVQAEKFHEALGLTGLTVTKLDGSAKGGILLAIADRIGVPVRFIGIGEAAEDMQPFSAEEFADALVSSGAQDETAA